MHAETGMTINITLECQRTWKLDSNKLAYNFYSTNIMIQDSFSDLNISQGSVCLCGMVGYLINSFMANLLQNLSVQVF